MKILYYGVHVQNAGWGAETFISKGLGNLGHKLWCIDYRRNRKLLFDIHKDINSREDVDVLFLQRGDGFPINILRDTNYPKVFWASELVSRCRDQDRLLEQHKLFDHIFFHTKECIDSAVKLFGIPRDKCSVLLNAYDKEVYKREIVDKDIGVLFCGNMTERRNKILDVISRAFPVKVVSVFGNEVSDYFNRSKIILNIHADNMLDTETRVFEALGSGSFLLTEKLSEENPFRNMIHLVEFQNMQELLWRINYYLINQNERDIIAFNGYAEASNNHTWSERAIEILEFMEKLCNYKLKKSTI